MQEYEAYQESLREADELKTEQQYIDYFASVKVDVAPGQFTLEQLRDLKAQYDGGLNTGIGQNPLLNLQQWQEWESLQNDKHLIITDPRLTTLNELNFRSSSNSSGSSQNQVVTVEKTKGFKIGSANSSVNYYSDYPNDPEIATKNPLALIPAILDWFSRFSNLRKPQEIPDNFFVSYQYTINERTGVLTIDDLSISNQYSSSPVVIRRVIIQNGNNRYDLVRDDVQLESGFGADFDVIEYAKSHFYSSPSGLNADVNSSVDIFVFGIGTENLGNGPDNMTYKFNITIPGAEK